MTIGNVIHSAPRLCSLMWCAGLLLTAFGTAQAVTVNLSGNLVGNSPCTVNNNQPISVDFGDVQIKDVQGQEGRQYERPVPYTIQCDNANANDAMNLKFSGALGWDGYLLQTSQPDLGLQFYVANQPIRVNDDVAFSYGNPPVITVVPEGRDTLAMNDAGAFSATASLTVEYQ